MQSDELTGLLPGCRPPLTSAVIAAGGSNVTSLLTDADGQRWILREPPTGRRLNSAHDMDREWRVLSALVGRYPVPVPIARVGSGYVMSYVDGLIIGDGASARTVDAVVRAASGASVVAALAQLHAVDLSELGLQDLGPTDDYVSRQLARWTRQLADDPVRDLPIVARIHDSLVASRPAGHPERVLVHGDYRLDNCVLGLDGSVTAVLDWEMATAGDPLADLAWLLESWAEPGDELTLLRDPPTMTVGFEPRAALADRYGRITGRDLSGLAWYRSFTLWKQGCIVEGVHARRRRGITSGGARSDGAELDGIAHFADRLLNAAAESL